MEDKKIKCVDCHKDFISRQGSRNSLKRKDSVNQSDAGTVGAKERLKKEPAASDVTDYWCKAGHLQEGRSVRGAEGKYSVRRDKKPNQK